MVLWYTPTKTAHIEADNHRQAGVQCTPNWLHSYRVHPVHRMWTYPKLDVHAQQYFFVASACRPQTNRSLRPSSGLLPPSYHAISSSLAGHLGTSSVGHVATCRPSSVWNGNSIVRSSVHSLNCCVEDQPVKTWVNMAKDHMMASWSSTVGPRARTLLCLWSRVTSLFLWKVYNPQEVLGLGHLSLPDQPKPSVISTMYMYASSSALHNSPQVLAVLAVSPADESGPLALGQGLCVQLP